MRVLLLISTDIPAIFSRLPLKLRTNNKYIGLNIHNGLRLLSPEELLSLGHRVSSAPAPGTNGDQLRDLERSVSCECRGHLTGRNEKCSAFI